jgi:hypothetical protein
MADSLVQEAIEELRRCGINDPELLRHRYDRENFGDSEAVFKIGRLIVRFVRDRGQRFIYLASSSKPDVFYQFDDAHIAMGWKSVEEVVAKQEPEPLHAVVERLADNLASLEDILSESPPNKMEGAANARREAFMAGLRSRAR